MVRYPPSPKFSRRYPWDEWLSPDRRSAKVLRQGRDFDCTTSGMAQMIRNVARRKGLKVSIRIVADGKLSVRTLVNGFSK